MNNFDHPPVLSADAILTPEEAADYLRVNPQTVYRKLARDFYPEQRLGISGVSERSIWTRCWQAAGHHTQTPGE